MAIYDVQRRESNLQLRCFGFLGLLAVFTIGGMTGVLMSIPGVDFQVHNSLFLIAHFHSTIIGGVLFGFFAGYTYWFPKFMGFKLNEIWGRRAFWAWLIGFILAFTPLYLLGFMGATRRLNHYEVLGWQPLFIIAGIGSLLISLGVFFQIVQVIVSIRERKKLKSTTGDPWNGRTLEWMTSSPPPFYNFAKVPVVDSIDPFWKMKHGGGSLEPKGPYHKIHMPRNTAAGFYIGVLSFFLGFGLIWYLFWMAAISALGIIACVIWRLYEKETEYYVQVAEIRKIEERA